jgi:hypothetical protein
MTRGAVVRAVASTPVNISGLPQTVNLALYEGDDFWLDLTVSDAAGGPADLTGMVAKSQIRKTASEVADQLLATFDCVIAGNIVHLHLPSSAAAMLSQSGVWDCQIATTGAPPLITTLAAGAVTVTPQVTV